MSGTTPKASPFQQWIDLAQPRLGSRAVFATDDFFAPRERLIDPRDPVFIADKFDDHGKWMDGWESRRKRESGYDYCIVRLGVPGVVNGLDIDTSHFTGNYPPSASVDACVSTDEVPAGDAVWRELLAATPLQGDSHHLLPVTDGGVVTHLRLNIYPDGGVARLRVYGEVRPERANVRVDGLIDLIAMENGGRALACNDEHFGSIHNLIAPGRGINMGDGWETRRRREPGNDWAIIALAQPGVVTRVIIDTAHFKGNYPDRASLQAARVSGGSAEVIATQSLFWDTLLPEVSLGMDAEHEFSEQVLDTGAVSHVRLNIFPDGGISRIRLLGHFAG